MPVDPFHIMIEGNDGVRIGRDDPLNPKDPEQKIWEISDSDIYKRRCPREFNSDADEALQAIGLKTTDQASPYLSYFQKRKEWLELELSQVETKIAACRPGESSAAYLADLEVQRGAYLNRLYIIREFTSNAVSDRLGNRLGLMARWEHDLLGTKITTEGIEYLGGTILTGSNDEWRTSYWMGSFDGDTMRGYMRGFLQVPFTKIL